MFVHPRVYIHTMKHYDTSRLWTYDPCKRHYRTIIGSSYHYSIQTIATASLFAGRSWKTWVPVPCLAGSGLMNQFHSLESFIFNIIHRVKSSSLSRSVKVCQGRRSSLGMWGQWNASIPCVRLTVILSTPIFVCVCVCVWVCVCVHCLAVTIWHLWLILTGTTATSYL
jgi:hypothetical protein